MVVCEAGGFAAYGMCEIPYYLGGMVAEPNLLAYPPGTVREKRRIDLRLHSRVTGVDPGTARCASRRPRGTPSLESPSLESPSPESPSPESPGPESPAWSRWTMTR